MTALDHNVFVSLGRAMARTNGYTAEQSSDLYITDGDQIDWLYAKYRIFTYTFELYPTEKRTVWGDHYPDDSKIPAQTARNRAAILLLIDRAGCPYATLGAATRRRLRSAVRRPRDQPGLEAQRRRDGHGDIGPVAGREPRTDEDRTGRSSRARSSRGPGPLVTGAARGRFVGSNDVDGGTTTIRSRAITLPADAADYGSLTFSYAFAHSRGIERRPTRSGRSCRPRTGRGRSCSSGRAPRPTSTGRGRPRRSRSRPTPARRSGSCSWPRTADAEPRRGGGRQRADPATLTPRPESKRRPGLRAGTASIGADQSPGATAVKLVNMPLAKFVLHPAPSTGPGSPAPSVVPTARKSTTA